ncbi:iron ABC transporter permease [Halomonas sp. McH1-25]|uniref:FecCD family ABC transporter permease n=1 Tax=unclassified Halomonas TaxID=2609666 RepID=UPI001EF4A2D3|nr:MULTISPECIES: iron ABC transporter permease [unclassified Halomonas]MCG7599219.1 iron ABC transporter permease [Halomonas sp. McH1-25]MCP1341087.1 iron ABC transporter permease [Halomonas sp. FL8]MCP1361693.1 iron ABC transporter permease [Halomonas sp. BBD45]
MFLLLSACLAVVCLLSLLFGAGEIGALDSLSSLLGMLDGALAEHAEEAAFVIHELRLPRTLIGLAVGMALGVAGALLQAVARNPLAEPGLLGVSAGSAFAVAVALMLGASAATLRISVAQLGALAGCLCVLAAARMRGVGNDPVRLVLAGAVLSGLLGALTSMILLIDQRTADEIRFWIVGSLAGRRLADLQAILPSLALAGIVTLSIGRPLAALALGERVAVGLGHHPRLVRLLAIGVVALLVGAATAVAGPIAFIGLVVPFAARALAGPDIRRTLWLCLPLGPLVVIGADIVSRLVVQPSELPLGVLTALIGAPVLIWVVRSRRLPTL